MPDSDPARHSVMSERTFFRSGCRARETSGRIAIPFAAAPFLPANVSGHFPAGPVPGGSPHIRACSVAAIPTTRRSVPRSACPI